MMQRSPLSPLVALACLIAVPSSASAQAFDHLRCYKVTGDVRPFVANSHLADLVSDEPEQFPDQQCSIKTKARFLCTDVDKQNVEPTPPGAAAGPQPGDFLCYKLKGRCTPALPTSSTLVVSDQFASGSLRILGPGLVCAPVAIEPPPTTTTTTSSTTTTTAPLSCNMSAPPTCGGACPDGNTCHDIGGFCFCFKDEHMPCAMDSPACAEDCPSGLVCVPGFGTACFCVPTAWEACGDSAPACDGACPPGFECNAGAVVCQCDPILP